MGSAFIAFEVMFSISPGLKNNWNYIHKNRFEFDPNQMLHAYLFWDYEQANKGAGDPRTQFEGGFEFEKDGRKGGVLLLCFCYFGASAARSKIRL